MRICSDLDFIYRSISLDIEKIHKKGFHFKRNPFHYQQNFFAYIKKLSKIPAATAEPITPATLGAMACISRWLVGSSFSPIV